MLLPSLDKQGKASGKINIYLRLFDASEFEFIAYIKRFPPTTYTRFRVGMAVHTRFLWGGEGGR